MAWPRIKTVKHAHGAPSNSSTTAVADLYLPPFHDYRNLSYTLAVDEHLI
ncbi:MAG: hypothetical protein JW984_12415 [Deltaproteobacteria bacterium]|uniref:Uncharacterized protein n=1 Tax=Candidatus Zymogenus saltonus TaxID=2844893 RepID=A0A9D8PNI8_9DELT|nr:hypothetical protein [Candidatus Zymogenus saltonus]